MQTATAHVLTALYSLCHGIALTDTEVEAIATSGHDLTPETWQRTGPALRTARDPALEPGLALHVLRWLSLEREASFTERYGIAIRETLVRDRTVLRDFARSLEREREQTIRSSLEARLLARDAWTERARRVRQRGTDDMRAAIAAFERALDAYPWWEERQELLFRELVEDCEAGGEDRRAKSALQRLRRIESAERQARTGHLRAAQALTVLWCMTHKMLLEPECGLDRTVRTTPSEWERIRSAAIAGRVDDIPIARQTLRLWGLEEVCDDTGLVGYGQWTRSALRAVELLWGDSRDENVSPDAVQHALAVVATRRASLLDGYRPPSDVVPNVWFETHQGCQRTDARVRVEILNRLGPMLARSPDPWLRACAALDRAGENESQGRYGSVRTHLETAVRLTEGLRDADRCQAAPLEHARWLRRCGETTGAKALLAGLSGEVAHDVARRIDDSAAARGVVARAEHNHSERGDVESWSALALAHLDAGHGVVAERMAGELCATHPGHALAWETEARIHYGNARFLAALDSAEKASDVAGDTAPGYSLLARILARLGERARAPAGRVAVTALEVHAKGQPLPVEDLEDLAEICHRAGFVDWARRGDDQIWSQREYRRPSAEWLGAAVARRCHGPWADDAPESLARLAKAGPPALARWVTERIEALHNWCDLIDRRKRAPRTWQRLASPMTTETRAILGERVSLSIHMEARRVALLGALTLGYSSEMVESVLEPPLLPADPESKAPEQSGLHSNPDPRWTAHLSDIEAAFGLRIVIAIRASEIAQQAWTALGSDCPDGAVRRIGETFQRERCSWIRWAIAQSAFDVISMDDVGGLTPLTRERLCTVRALAGKTDDELRACTWSTKWDDLDRW